MVGVAVVALLLGLMLGRGARAPETRLAQAPPAAALVQRVASPPPAALAEPVAVAVAPVQQVAAAARAPLPVEQRPGAVKRATPKKAATPADTSGSSPQPPPPVLAVAPERAEVPQRGKPPDPLALCADSNFVARPMCIFRQCQKPEMARLPLCVENNARLQNNRRADGF